MSSSHPGRGEFLPSQCCRFLHKTSQEKSIHLFVPQKGERTLPQLPATSTFSLSAPKPAQSLPDTPRDAVFSVPLVPAQLIITPILFHQEVAPKWLHPPRATLSKCCVALGTKLALSLDLTTSLPPPQRLSLKGKGAVESAPALTVTSNPATQMVNMHMEKVARREIGTLATVQRLHPSQKVIAPESLPPLTPYFRKPLNFGCLDDIGHGIKVETGPLLFLHHLPPLFCLTAPFPSTSMFLSPRPEANPPPAKPSMTGLHPVLR